MAGDMLPQLTPTGVLTGVTARATPGRLRRSSDKVDMLL